MLSGDEEAALVFDGAIRNLRAPTADPVLVVDIGGGSTELVLGGGTARRRAVSMDIGSVRLHERHLHGDPPTAEEVAACVADIDAAPRRVPRSTVGRRAAVVGTSGTIKTLAARGARACRPTTATRIDGAVLSVVDETTAYVDAAGRAMTVAERRALPYMHPGRADVIGAGALILDRVLRRLGVVDRHASPRPTSSTASPGRWPRRIRDRACRTR